MTLKDFIFLPENKKAYWRAFNWFLAASTSYLTYLVADNVVWAITVLPIYKVVAEMFTRYFNNAYEALK